MRKLVFVLLFVSTVTLGQVINTGVMDTSAFNYGGKVTVEGYIDAYYAYDFNKPPDNNRPYFVSMSRHNEVTINLAYVDLKYSSSRLRARFVPGFGTYMNANYAAEQGTLKNIVEASAGIKLSSRRNVWVDAGIFGSPYTNESAFSKDHLAYTRSFAPEYVPYYLAGLKLTLPLSSRVNCYLYFINGWQQIVDQNKYKSVGTQIEVRPSDNLLINWDTYIGKEQSAGDTTIGMRYFTDVYMIFRKERWSATTCIYVGLQQQANQNATWWQANAIVQYDLTQRVSLAGRIEYFDDPGKVQIVPLNGISGFQSSSASLGLNFKMADNVLIRLEGRSFFSREDVYLKEGTEPVKSSHLLTSNLTLWF